MQNSWFASDVTAAMLDGKDNDLSLRWELNFIIMQILRKEIVLYCQPTWPQCHVGANQEYCSLVFRTHPAAWPKAKEKAWKLCAISFPKSWLHVALEFQQFFYEYFI